MFFSRFLVISASLNLSVLCVLSRYIRSYCSYGNCNHKCNKPFLRFYSGHVFYVLNVFKKFFHVFLFKKTLSSAKYKYVKIQRKIFLEDDLAIIFIDFGLFRRLYCKISYLLAEEHWSHTNLGIWQPTYDSVCKDNSLIHGKCRQRFLLNVYKRFFLFSSQRLLHLWL